MKFGFLGNAVLIVGFALCAFQAQASKDRATQTLRACADTIAKAGNETFARPKIFCQQLYGSNPDLTPLIEQGNDMTFTVCFVLKHDDKENHLVNTLPLTTDCVCYAAQAQKTEIKLSGELIQCQTINRKMVIHGAAQVVGSFVALGMMRRYLPSIVGNLAVIPCWYSAGVGVEKIYHGANYREYLQRRLDRTCAIKKALGDKDCIDKIKALSGVGSWAKRTEEAA